MRSDSSLDRNFLWHYLILRDPRNPPVVKKKTEPNQIKSGTQSEKRSLKSKQKEVDNKVASKVHRRQEGTQKTQKKQI